MAEKKQESVTFTQLYLIFYNLAQCGGYADFQYSTNDYKYDVFASPRCLETWKAMLLSER